MNLTITKRYTFEAHHKLPWHDGKCANDHGHSYVLEVSVRGRIKPNNGQPDSGMVMDFGRVSDVVKPLIEAALDHHSLNHILQNPTAERLVEWLIPSLRADLELDGTRLVRLRLYETATAWVEWEAADA